MQNLTAKKAIFTGFIVGFIIAGISDFSFPCLIMRLIDVTIIHPETYFLIWSCVKIITCLLIGLILFLWAQFNGRMKEFITSRIYVIIIIVYGIINIITLLVTNIYYYILFM